MGEILKEIKFQETKTLTKSQHGKEIVWRRAHIGERPHFLCYHPQLLEVDETFHFGVIS